MRIAVFNVGGLQTHSNYLYEFVAEHNTDVLLLSETHSISRSSLQHITRTFGWRVIAVSRAAGELKCTTNRNLLVPSGGVAVVNCKPSVYTITSVGFERKGAIAVELRRRNPSSSPLILVSAYCPPKGSVYEQDGVAVHQFIQRTIKQTRTTHGGDFVIGIDANARIGEQSIFAGSPRSSDDKKLHNEKSFLGLLRDIKGAPAHSTNATSTSRSVAGGCGFSVVDYCVVPNNWDHTRFSTRSSPSWDSIPNSSSHRPLLVEVSISSQPAAPDALRAPLPRWAHLAPGDERWGKIMLSTTGALGGDGADAATLRDCSHASATESFIALERVMEAVLDEHAKPTPRRSTSDRRTPFMRKRKLPVEIVKLFQAAREARSRLRRNKHSSRRDSLRAAMNATQRRASRALRRLRRTWEKDEASRLTELHTKDPRRLFQTLRREHAPDEPWHADDNESRLFIPSEPGMPPAHLRFFEHYRKSFSVPKPAPVDAVAAVRSLVKCGLVKSAPEPRVGRRFQTDDIIRVLFPGQPVAARNCPATGEAEDSCPVCEDARSRRAAYKGPHDTMNAPPAASSLNPNAVCHGDLSPFHFTFPRGSKDDTSQYRSRICAAISTIINRALEEGMMPAIGAESKVIWLLKLARGQVGADLAAESSYRPITMGRALSKIMGLALLDRITHWVRTHNIVSTSAQGAFTATLGGSYHVWALSESIRFYWRNGKLVYVVFFDLVRAYSEVDIDFLFELLKARGLAHNVINLFRSWALQRRSRVSVNGFLSEAFRTINGIGQGETPAPTFFNIFMDPLAEMLKEAGLNATIRPAGVGIEITLFADDIAEPSLSYAGVKAATEVTQRWAKLCGMEINTKPGKSEAVLFAPPRTRAAQPEPLLLDDGNSIKWVTGYRYLGVRLNSNLSTTDLVGSLRSTLSEAYAQVADYNGVIRRLSPSLRVILYNSLVVSKISYVLPFLPLNETTYENIDIPLRKVARDLFWASLRVPSSILHVESGLPMGLYLVVRARVHLLLSLKLAPVRDAPAVALLSGLSEEIGTRLELVGSHTSSSWAFVTMDMLYFFEKLGVPFPNAQSRHQIAAVAKAYARACALAQLRVRELARGTSLTGFGTGRPTPSASSVQHAADLAFGYSHDQTSMGSGRVTCVSARVPMGAGALLRLTTRRGLSAGVSSVVTRLLLARLGAASFTHAPYAPDAWLLDPNDKIYGVSVVEKGDYKAAGHGFCCPLCGSSAAADPWHIINECTAPPVLRAADKVRSRLAAHAAVLTKILKSTHSAGGDPANTAAVREAAVRVLAALKTADWTTADGKFLAFRLILVLPFPAAVLPPGGTPCAGSLTRAMGELMDAVCVRQTCLKDLANYWVGWGGHAYDRVATAWRTAVNAMKPAAAPRRPRLQ